MLDDRILFWSTVNPKILFIFLVSVSFYFVVVNINILFVESQLIYVVKDLFSAGVDTTDNTIGFVIAFLVVYQNVQAKIHEEIDKVIGRDIYPAFSDRDR